MYHLGCPENDGIELKDKIYPSCNRDAIFDIAIPVMHASSMVSVLNKQRVRCPEEHLRPLSGGAFLSIFISHACFTYDR